MAIDLVPNDLDSLVFFSSEFPEHENIEAAWYEEQYNNNPFNHWSFRVAQGENNKE